jgi:RNA polymerase sigma-70 factor, ECF subfamily
MERESTAPAGHQRWDASSERADEAQLSEAFRAHRRELHGFAYRRLIGDAGLAEEAVQETFLRAWRSRHLFDASRGSLRMWLFAICRSAASDTARQRARHQRREIRPVVEPSAADGVVEAVDARQQIAKAFRHVSPGQLEAIVDVHVRERSYADTAARLDLPVGTVKSRVHLGLQAARQALAAVA